MLFILIIFLLHNYFCLNILIVILNFENLIYLLKITKNFLTAIYFTIVFTFKIKK